MLLGRHVTLIVAAAETDVIGLEGKMPWHLPNDLKRFKRLTVGHPVIMGRRTWASLGTPLPDRQNIVLTRSQSFQADGVTVTHTIDDALNATPEACKVMIIGGGEIYRLFFQAADLIERTVVHVQVEGDTTFPAIPDSDWVLLASEHHPIDDRHAHEMTFETWQRR